MEAPPPNLSARSLDTPKLDAHRTESDSSPSNLNFHASDRVSNQPPQQDLSTVSQSSTNVILSSFPTLGPLVARFAAAGSLPEPLFTVTLQRDSIEIGGNVGALNIGQLPANVLNESLTWIPLRTYTADQGGLRPPPNSPNEVRRTQFR